MTRRRFVIVGGGLAAASAAVTLRDEGFDGAIVLIGDEPHEPYERPPLSKTYLRGETAAADARFLPDGWFDAHDVDLRVGTRVEGIDLDRRRVRLADGTDEDFDRLLVATGGRNRTLPVPGHDLEGVLQLRTLEDADRIRAAAEPGARVVVVGAGFVGCEVAASLRALGLEVDVVEVFETALVRGVGPEVGRVLEGIHRDHGVRFHMGQGVERFMGPAGGRVAEVATDRGTRIGCDLVVVGVGIVPNTEVVRGTAVAVDDGIVVDAACRSSVEGVYAAGDVATHDHPLFGRLRVEHWDNAIKQGAAAARGMLGSAEPFADPHWFWSDQYDHELQVVGSPVESDELVVRGRLEDRSFLGFYLKDGRVRAAVGLDRGREVRRASALIAAAAPVDPAALRDEDVDLRRLAATARRA
jgi:3-phenylpropionate/trans-cinnamate dioxygenase ferredoxin reductase subunit